MLPGPYPKEDRMSISEEMLTKAINLEDLQYYSEHLVVPVIAVATEGYQHATERSVSDENGVHGIRYHDGALQVVEYEYTAVTPASGDNPAEQGWYELDGSDYVLTADTSVVSGKTYYSRSESWEEAGGGGGTTLVQIPTLSGSTTFTYDGSEKSITLTGFDSSTMTITDGSATNAGEYTAVVALKNTARMMWTDMTTQPKTFTWEIEKATGAISLDKTSVALNASKLTDTITATVTGDGVLSVESSDDGIAAVSLSGNVATVESVDSTTGSVTITFSVPATNNYTAASATATVTCTFTTVYGAQWDGTSTTAWTRTDAAAGFSDPVPYVKNAASYSSPFDNLMPWSGMVKSERTGGTMVAIPKFYYKLTQSGSSIKVQIADGPMDGYSVSPAHADRGDGSGERDVVYIGRYHCASDYKSKTGVAPKANITRSTARTGIHNLGSNIWQMDFAVRFTIWLLYIVEFADWNSQAKIGYGCGNNSSAQNMGASDSMPYHTGTMQTSRTAYGVGTQYRYIEGLWDNVYDWMDGCYYNNSGLNLIMNPSKFSDSSNGTLAGKPSSGYPSAFAVTSNGGFPMFYPTAANGSNSTYSCDGWDFDGSNPCLCVGGYYGQNLYHGLFFVYYDTASSAYGSVGCRLLELP